LGVPVIFRAVSLIANTTGSLAMEVYRDGQKLPFRDTPQLVKRPDPFRTPRDFYRDTAWHLAASGEVWWWVAKRDTDDTPMSLIVVPPWEVQVDPKLDRLHPEIRWLDKVMDPDDMRQITFMPDGTSGRGVGPLQLCGASMSVAVESEQWAANFYAGGGYPSILIKAAGALGATGDVDDDNAAITEANLLREQFMSKDHNTPRVIDEGIESVDEFNTNTQGAQMLDARLANRGDWSVAFGIPGALLEYAAPGSTLTYQNAQDVFPYFVKGSLSIGYLEPIEQTMTDLLSRSTAARFNVKGFERADPKSRWETYKLMSEVLGLDEAARIAMESEGFAPGDIEYAPVPFSPPAAVPTRLPVARSADPVRCSGKRMLRGRVQACGKLLAEAGPFTGSCPRCGTGYVDAA
jgi:phage portal protein BeeE